MKRPRRMLKKAGRNPKTESRGSAAEALRKMEGAQKGSRPFATSRRPTSRLFLPSLLECSSAKTTCQRQQQQKQQQQQQDKQGCRPKNVKTYICGSGNKMPPNAANLCPLSSWKRFLSNRFAEEAAEAPRKGWWKF